MVFIPAELIRWAGIEFHLLVWMASISSMSIRRLPWVILLTVWLGLCILEVRHKSFCGNSPIYWSRLRERFRHWSVVFWAATCLVRVFQWWTLLPVAFIVYGLEWYKGKNPTNLNWLFLSILCLLKIILWGNAKWWGLLLCPIGLLHFHMGKVIAQTRGVTKVFDLLYEIHMTSLALHMSLVSLYWYAMTSHTFPYEVRNGPLVFSGVVVLLSIVFVRVLGSKRKYRVFGLRGLPIKLSEKFHVTPFLEEEICSCKLCGSLYNPLDMESNGGDGFKVF